MDGYCNACGEEMDEADECCDDGEFVPYELTSCEDLCIESCIGACGVGMHD